MSLKKIALVGFLAVMIPVVLVSVGNFLGLPSPIPSLIGTLCVLWVLGLFTGKTKTKTSRKSK